MRRTRKRGLDTKLITNVIIASLMVQKSPDLLAKFGLPLDPKLRPVIGGGAGFLLGSFMKKPEISNSSLALAVTDLLSSFIDPLIGGTPEMIPASMITGGMKPVPPVKQVPMGVADYYRLNDYSNNAEFSRNDFNQYNETYL